MKETWLEPTRVVRIESAQANEVEKA